MGCAALSVPDTMWNFCPNIGASALFLVLFILTTAAHLFQAIRYRKAYCWVIVMSGVWQVFTYIFRTASIKAPDSFGMYAAWFVLILVAPLWTNAFTYMVFGRLVWNETADRKVWGLKAVWFGAVFVVLDIIAFIIQVYGAAQASSQNANPDVILTGLHVYMAGVGIQLLFILICGCFSIKLFAIMWTTGDKNSPPLLLIYTQFSVMILIIVGLARFYLDATGAVFFADRFCPRSRSGFCFASSSTRVALTAVSPTMKLSSIVWIRCQCLSHSCCTISSTPAASFAGRKPKCLQPGSNGRNG